MVHKYCWKVVVTFRCGCVESPPTTHLCGPGRQNCDAWVTHENVNRDCEGHRLGWGLQQSSASASAFASPSPSLSPSSFSSLSSVSSSADRSCDHEEEEGGSGHSIDGAGAEGRDKARQWYGEMGRRRTTEGHCAGQGTTGEGCYVRRRM